MKTPWALSLLTVCIGLCSCVAAEGDSRAAADGAIENDPGPDAVADAGPQASPDPTNELSVTTDRNPVDGNRPAWGEFSASFTENVHGGNGWAWVTTLGGSPRDFPGSAGLIAPWVASMTPANASLVTAGLPELSAWSAIGGFCAEVRSADSKGASVAVRLSPSELEHNKAVPAGRATDEYWSSQCPGCPGAPSKEDLARREDDSSLERHATAGTELLLLDPPAGQRGAWNPAQLRSKLLRTVFRPPHPDWSILRLGREAARRYGRELRLAAALPASIGRDNIWPVAGMLDLVTGVPRKGEQLDPFRILAFNRTLRARGKRALLHLDTVPKLSGDTLLQWLALHLISGAAVMSDAPEKVPASVRSALSLAQQHPEFFFLRSGRVGLYYSLASMSTSQSTGAMDPHGDGIAALDFFGLSRLLDELHIPYKVIFAGDGISVDDAFESERLGLYDVVLVPRSKRLSEVEYQALADMSNVGAVVLSGASGSLDLQGRGVEREPLGSDDGQRVFTLTQGGADYLADPSAERRQALAVELASALSVRSTSLAARVHTSLPASVLVERVMDPRSSTLIHHLINIEEPEKANAEVGPTAPSWIRIPAWPRPADLDYEVRLYTPSAPAGVLLEYLWLAESNELQVQLPSLGVWSVLSMRPRLNEADERSGPITIEAPALDPGAQDRESRQVSFDVPAWPGGRRKLTLRAPEDVISGSGIAGLGENLRASWDLAKDGSRATLRARNEHISVVVGIEVVNDFIDVDTRIANLGSRPIERVEAMFCLDPGDLDLFPDSGLDRNYLVRGGKATSLGSERHGSGTPNFSEGTAFDLPMTVLESVDDRWSLGHAFEQTQILGANGSGGGVCIHTRPRFGDLAVGAASTRKGRIYLSRGRAEGLFARLRKDKPFSMPLSAPPEATLQHPCVPSSSAR